MADYEGFRVGGVTFPLTPPTVSLLLTCDPAIYWALEFYGAVITHHVGAVLLSEAAGCGAPVAQAVATRIPYDPGPHLFTRPEIRFPLLAVYRQVTRYSDRTVTWTHEESEWGIAYVLPVLAPAQADRLLPILRAVAQVVHQATDRSFDPAYGAATPVWDHAHGGVESIGLIESSYGTFDDSRGLPIHAWFGKALVRERTMPLAGTLPALDGADTSISTNDGADEADVVALNTEHFPPVAG